MPSPRVIILALEDGLSQPSRCFGSVNSSPWRNCDNGNLDWQKTPRNTSQGLKFWGSSHCLSLRRNTSFHRTCRLPFRRALTTPQQSQASTANWVRKNLRPLFFSLFLSGLCNATWLYRSLILLAVTTLGPMIWAEIVYSSGRHIPVWAYRRFSQLAVLWNCFHQETTHHGCKLWKKAHLLPHASFFLVSLTSIGKLFCQFCFME